MAYLFEEMVTELGLDEGEDWNSEFHENVAMNIVLGNPNINTREILMNIVARVQKIPLDRIEKVTTEELITEFGFIAFLQ